MTLIYMPSTARHQLLLSASEASKNAIWELPIQLPGLQCRGHFTIDRINFCIDVRVPSGINKNTLTKKVCLPVERDFLRRSLPARSTMNSLPILTFCKGPASCPGAVLWRLMMVSITMAWLRLECAFSLVKAKILHAQQISERCSDS